IARADRPYPRGGSGRDDVSDFQGHDPGGRLNELRDPEHHLVRVRVLAHDAIHSKPNRKPVWIEVRICGDGLRYRSKGVKPFRSCPWGTFLPRLRLHVPRCDVEEHGISSDVVHRGDARNVAASLIQDDRELGLDLDPPRFRWDQDRPASKKQRGCRFEEEDRLVRNGGAHFLRMIRVVAGHTQNLRNPNRAMPNRKIPNHPSPLTSGCVRERSLIRTSVIATTAKETPTTKLTSLPKSPYSVAYNSPRTTTRLKTACIITAVR